jgi:hypothetical protein
MSQVRYGFSQGKAKPTKKNHCAKQAQKQLLRKQEHKNGVEVAKETENLHKNHNPVAVENKHPQ